MICFVIYYSGQPEPLWLSGYRFRLPAMPRSVHGLYSNLMHFSKRCAYRNNSESSWLCFHIIVLAVLLIIIITQLTLIVGIAIVRSYYVSLFAIRKK
jgi:hypothetical protein